MKNLEQVRAAHALAFYQAGNKPLGDNGGNVISKIPSMIVADGLLATAAFAMVKKEGFLSLATNIFKHLKSQAIVNGDTLPAQLKSLADADAVSLQRATSEALAYANYLKRFGKFYIKD
jgi:CRISPR type III-B/RAMP module-associated protein Cmr5